jgi:hypothetical protein
MKNYMFLLLFIQGVFSSLFAQTDSTNLKSENENSLFLNVNTNYAIYLGYRSRQFPSQGDLWYLTENFNIKNSFGSSASIGYEYNLSSVFHFQIALNYCIESNVYDFSQTSVRNAANSPLHKTIERFHAFRMPMNFVISTKRFGYLLGITFVTFNFQRSHYIYEDHSKELFFKQFILMREMRINQSFRYRISLSKPLFLLAGIEISPAIFKRSDWYFLYPNLGLQWNLN